MNGETKFMDLNVDCQLQIIDHLDVSSLITLSATSKHLSVLVTRALKSHFSNKRLIVVITNVADKQNHRIQEDSKYIRIQNIRTSSKMLKYFGHAISNLTIEFNLLHDQLAKTIYRLVNLYCSKTLKQLHLVNTRKDFFDEFTTPFENVEAVSLHGKHMKMDIAELNLREIFPKMDHMSLGIINVLDSVWMPQDLLRTNFADDSIVERIISGNPQIRSLAMINVSPKMLAFIGDKLPLLESLIINIFTGFDLSNEHQEIHLENVKHLDIKFFRNALPPNIIFDKLETFETEGFPPDCLRWIEFVENHKNIRKLHVTRELTNAEFLRLAAVNASLSELTLSCAMSVRGDTISKLIENANELQKLLLTLSGRTLWDSVVSILRERVASEWTWTGDMDSYQISIARENGHSHI